MCSVVNFVSRRILLYPCGRSGKLYGDEFCPSLGLWSDIEGWVRVIHVVIKLCEGLVNVMCGTIQLYVLMCIALPILVGCMFDDSIARAAL